MNPFDPPPVTYPDDRLDMAARNATFAADNAVINAMRDGTADTAAARTRIGVRAALDCLAANGIITIRDPTGWPEWVSMEATTEVGAAR